MAAGRKTGGRRAGTPNRATASIREVARKYTGAALTTLDGIMRDPKEQAVARIRAAEILLDRGYGKPAQAVIADVTSHETGPRLIIVSGPKEADNVVNDGSGAPTLVLPDNGRRRLPGADQPRPPRPVKAPAAEAQPARPPPPRAQTVRIYDPYGDRGTRVIPAAEFDPARHELADGPSAFAVNMPGL